MVRASGVVLLAFLLVLAGACLPGIRPAATVSPIPARPPAAAAAPTVGFNQQAPGDGLQAAEGWEDRSIFRAGLVAAEQPSLQALAGATEYHLDVDIAENLLSLRGRERVRYTNQETTTLDAVYFQLFPNMAGGKTTVTTALLDGRGVTTATEFGGTTLRVSLPDGLAPGRSATVQLEFELVVPRELGGGYGLFGYLDGILALDGFYPAIPVYDSNGWHIGPVPPNADTTFQDVSFYQVTVTAPATLTLVTSGIAVARDKKDDAQTVTFAAGPARDFYIAASDRFVVSSETVGETRVNSYSLPEREEGRAAALRTAVAAIRSYSARFGAYPYSEFDVVSTPMQGATGIEYPGVTGISLAVYDPAATVSGVAAPVMLESTVAHEVGHQWFYNLVGNDQANEPWLDEAVTQYVTGLYFLDSNGQQAMDGYRATWFSRWDRVNRQAIPIGLPAGEYRGREYGAIVYGRGPLFEEALANRMGQAVFDAFLRRYVQANRWGIASTASFKLLAEQECGCDLTPMFEEWIYRK